MAPQSDDAVMHAVRGQWWTDDEDRAVRWKLDRRIIPILFMVYGLGSIDRSNIGNAHTAGMDASLHMDDAQYQWLLTIFYIAYSLSQVQVFMYSIAPAHIWVSLCMFVWGVASMLQAAATSWSGMMAARFFLGIAEAGYGMGVVMYLSFFYPKREIGIRFAFYFTSSAIASAFASALAYAIVHAKVAIDDWRLLFIIEAIPTLLMCVLVFLLLPDSCETASFLTLRERDIAKARRFRAPQESAQAAEPHASILKRILGRVDWKHAGDAFKDPVSYLNASLLFIVNVAYSSVPVYLPTILKDMGYSSINAQGLAAPPYLVAWILSLLVVYASDRANLRGPFIIALDLLAGVGYIMLAALESTAARYTAVYLVTVGLFTSVPIIYMYLISNQVGDSKRSAGLTIFGTLGQCGPFLGTRLFPASEGPYYVRGMGVSAGLTLFSALLVACASGAFWVLNRRRAAAQGGALRDEKSTPLEDDDNDEAFETDERKLSPDEAQRRIIDIATRGEASPYFRYTL